MYLNRKIKIVILVAVYFTSTPKSVSGGASVERDLFVKVNTCFDPTIANSNTYQTASDKICAMFCMRSKACKSFSFITASHTCYLNGNLQNDTGCTNSYIHYNSKQSIDEPRCFNEGVHDNSTNTCKCVNGYVGNRCERLMQHCTEGYASGHYTGMSGVFFVHPVTSSIPFRVRCEMEYQGRTVILRQNPDYPYLNFTKTWTAYKTGFGDMDDKNNFYVGNEITHLLTAVEKTLLLVDAVFDEPGVNYRQYMYTVKVASEVENYRLNISKSFVDLNHALDNCFPGNNIAFSTIDRDNDASAGSCAQTHMSGWWFDDCGPCNPTGQVQPRSEKYQNGEPASLTIAAPTNLAVRQIKKCQRMWSRRDA